MGDQAVRLVGVREAAQQLCRVVEEIADPTPHDLHRWSHIITMWTRRHGLPRYGQAGEWRYDLRDLWPYAQRWHPRPRGRVP